jgi:hypothetical protein
MLDHKTARTLPSGALHDDYTFDRALPAELRAISGQYWTPLCVALRAATWLEELGIRTVVDIGSGAGKFCVATALASQCELVGIEQRPRLVHAARGLAQTYEVTDRVRFVHGTFGEVPVPLADAYYLYNPFGENLFGRDETMSNDVELGGARFERDVAYTQSWFSRLPADTYMITYNGFGGRVPPGYREVRVDHELPCVLRMWRKMPGSDAGISDIDPHT